jgi:hypothetical protein
MAEKEEKVYIFPKTIGACVDKAYKLREKRHAIAQQVTEVEHEEHALKEHIINSFSKDSIEGAKGTIATASLQRKTVATVKDWDKFYEYIKKTKSFDLLQKRVSDGAYRERLEAGKAIPGVEPFQVLSLSLTKR